MAIKSICPDIFAIELSSHRKKYLKKKKIEILDVKKFDNYKNYFDIIRLEQVLEHIDYLEETLSLIKKFLKKGGIITIGVPDGKYEIKNNIFKIEKGPIQPLEHLNCFNNNSLKLLFKKNGFKSISIIKIVLLFLKNKKFDYPNLKFICNFNNVVGWIYGLVGTLTCIGFLVSGLQQSGWVIPAAIGAWFGLVLIPTLAIFASSELLKIAVRCEVHLRDVSEQLKKK